MDYSSNHYSENAGVLAGAGIFLLILFALILLLVISTWRIFEKAGKPGWAALVPIYRTMVMIEIVGKPTIWILWCLLPCTSFIFGIWLINLLNKSFGKEEGFTVGMIFLPFIFWPILGFGDAKYLGPSAAEAQPGFGNPYHNNPDNPFSPFYRGNQQSDNNGNNNPNDTFNQPPTPPATPEA